MSDQVGNELARLTVEVDRLTELVGSLRMHVADLRKAGPHADVSSLLLSATGVAQLVDVSPRTLRRIRKERGFPKPVKGPGHPRWRRRDIEKWIEANR